MDQSSGLAQPQEVGGSGDLDGIPDQGAVAHRADGRPPEEETSEDPMAQSKAILEDSEERTAEGAENSGLISE